MLNNDGGMVPVLSLHSTGKQKGETKKSIDEDTRCFCAKGTRRKRNKKENVGRGEIKGTKKKREKEMVKYKLLS